MRFILDTNIISAGFNGDTQILAHLETHRTDEIYLCQPVYYEVMRGLIWKKAASKILTLQKLHVRLGWIELTDEDWQRATRLWVEMVSRGRQLSDVDLLIAAIAIRLDAVIVTADADFDALPVRRENWRQP